jgi:hypothetical protein
MKLSAMVKEAVADANAEMPRPTERILSGAQDWD